MARQALTVGHIDSDGILFRAGTPVEGAMGEFIAVPEDPENTGSPLGMSFMNDGDKRTLLAIDNRSLAVDATVTIETYGTVDGMAIADRTLVVAAGDMALIRPGPASVYNQPDGSIYFDVDVLEDVYVAVVKVDA